MNGANAGSSCAAPVATAVALALLASTASSSAAPDRPTFNRDIEPIVRASCAPCHRPGESGPFDLLTYGDVRKRARQIVRVTRSRFMPPWLPEPGFAEFLGQRRLSDEQIGTIQRWVAAGTPRGDPADLAQAAQWTDGWQLGEPDLVVTMPETYTLPADGFDVFRNFVIPVPVARTHWVKAVELRPGDPRVVHHGVMRVDRTQSSRRLAEQDPEPGFGSMNMGDAEAPDGHSINWTPGMLPYAGSEELPWRLDRGTDLVLQLHMQPSGKPETIRPSIGLYHADGPPSRRIYRLVLHSREIDIPAGTSDHVIEDSYEIPVGLEVLSVYPHAHYLGRDMQGWAMLPDGTKHWLLRITDWDFNWQDSYRYAERAFLPAGTTVHMRFTYDNSEDNPRNPNVPPRRVVGGSQSTDEKGSLSFELLPPQRYDLALLTESFSRQDVAKKSDDWLAHNNLAAALHRLGKLDEAAGHYRETLRLNPSRTDAYNNLGLVLQSQGRLDPAMELYREALQLNPFYAHAHYNLGNALTAKARLDEAIGHYERALQLKPYYAEAHYNLALALQTQGQLDPAVRHYRAALEIEPDDAGLHNNLGNVLAGQGNLEGAAGHYRQALRLDDRLSDAHANLGNVLLMQGLLEQAIDHYRRALRIRPDSADVRYNLTLALQMRDELANGE